MRPDNSYTTPEQRFFFPNGKEAEHHESFDLAGLPQAEILDGEDGYVVVDEPRNSGEIAVQSGHAANLRPGSQLKKIITLGVSGDESSFPYKTILHPDGSDGSDDKRWLESPVDTYDIQEDDLLVLEVDTVSLAHDAGLREQIDENSVILWPANKKLPYSDGEQEGDNEARDVSYNLHGVITPELRFIGWKGGSGSRAQSLVDMAVANASMQNELERAVLSDKLVTGASLMGMLSVEKGVTSFLKHFKEQTGKDFIPTKNPDSRYGEFPQMTDEQRARYEFVSEAYFASIQSRQS